MSNDTNTNRDKSISDERQLTEDEITITGVDPVLVLGFHDQHLSKLDQAYPETKLTARGDRIKMLGPQEDVEELKDVIEELVALSKRNGSLSKQDLETVLSLKESEHQEAEESDEQPPEETDIPPTTPKQPAPWYRSKDSDVILHTHMGEVISAKTPGQQEIVQESQNNDIVFAIGPAGTGKTFTSVALSVKALQERRVKKIILARPAVEAGENLGFLPGDLKEKIDPYLRPLYDSLEEMIEHDRLELNLSKNIVEIAPLAYMRGRTLNNAFVILDEAQNATNVQMKMFLTRLGFNSQAIITGDITQTDLPKRQESGLVSIQKILKDIEGISFVYLGQKDVVRHKLIRQIIEAYENYEAGESDSSSGKSK